LYARCVTDIVLARRERGETRAIPVPAFFYRHRTIYPWHRLLSSVSPYLRFCAYTFATCTPPSLYSSRYLLILSLSYLLYLLPWAYLREPASSSAVAAFFLYHFLHLCEHSAAARADLHVTGGCMQGGTSGGGRVSACGKNIGVARTAPSRGAWRSPSALPRMGKRGSASLSLPRCAMRLRRCDKRSAPRRTSAAHAGEYFPTLRGILVYYRLLLHISFCSLLPSFHALWTALRSIARP